MHVRMDEYSLDSGSRRGWEKGREDSPLSKRQELELGLALLNMATCRGEEGL